LAPVGMIYERRRSVGDGLMRCEIVRGFGGALL
jgi:hypothetical protein